MRTLESLACFVAHFRWIQDSGQRGTSNFLVGFSFAAAAINKRDGSALHPLTPPVNHTDDAPC
ncbi:MAG TPA: hypothetical protein VMM76_22545 [Pirellulaceae bacterium]|nr:hypothetical protein [Pirellulaceae bacterium]